MEATIGVDLGTVRIGIAAGTGSVATPLEVLERTDDRNDAVRIAALARDRGASTVVVGHPIRLDGAAGPAAETAERFADELRRHDVEVVLWDERLTTVTAERAMAGTTSRQRRGRVDKVAAAVMLQSWLDARTARGAPG
jgi:putative Holliday junction resolvase